MMMMLHRQLMLGSLLLGDTDTHFNNSRKKEKRKKHINNSNGWQIERRSFLINRKAQCAVRCRWWSASAEWIVCLRQSEYCSTLKTAAATPLEWTSWKGEPETRTEVFKFEDTECNSNLPKRENMNRDNCCLGCCFFRSLSFRLRDLDVKQTNVTTLSIEITRFSV